MRWPQGHEKIISFGVAIKVEGLTDFDAVVEAAAETGYIRPEDCARLIAFRNNPSDESWIHK